MTVSAEKPVYNLSNPFLATVVENRLLSRDGSDKETRHIVVDITGSGMEYTCGDSLAIFPINRSRDVQDLLDALRLDGSEPVTLPRQEEPMTLRAALEGRLYFLAGPSRKFLEAVRERATAPRERERLDALLSGPEAELTRYLEERHCCDILEEHPSARFTAQEIVPQLKRLVPRLYSIASSPALHPCQIHLTVAVVRYRTLDRERVGVGSTHLVDRVTLNAPSLPVFVTTSHFRLPENPARDIIMVGPGTGVAPFRAFLQQREASGAQGRNWLFFGDRHRACDYLYGEEFEAWRERGHLTRLDLAWSRDQAGKVYVQHRLWDARDEFWDWFSKGAVLYVCGDKARMARDVEETLARIAVEKGAVTDDPESIKSWLRDLKKQKRYLQDGY